METLEFNSKAIPGFSKYALINDEYVSPAKKHDVKMTIKKGTSKYYLQDDKGKLTLISLDEVKILCNGGQLPVKETKVKATAPAKEKKPAVKKVAPKKTTKPAAKAKKVAKPAKKVATKKTKVEEETKGQTILRFKENTKVQKILKEDGSKDRKMMKLHNMGLKNYQIAYLTDSSKGNVARGIWMYNNGHRTL